MRLDKFLKVSRIIKRRQTAKEVSDAGKISVNGKVAKSSTVLQQGDEITLHYATRTLVVKVKEIKDSTKKEDAQLMYEIVEERHLNSCPFGWT
ncbi:MAG: RNA-binding S4 domain-containing protein [Defluviitaleaceae bacterium]|nr:RNA-binding S4 domain-containing protein [Defluviitaleaceae bacterium]